MGADTSIRRIRWMKANERWPRWLELATAWAQRQRRHCFVVDGLGVWLWPYVSLEHLPSRGWEIRLDNGRVVGTVLGKLRPKNRAVIRFLSITGVLPPDGGDNLQSTGIATAQKPRYRCRVDRGTPPTPRGATENWG